MRYSLLPVLLLCCSASPPFDAGIGPGATMELFRAIEGRCLRTQALIGAAKHDTKNPKGWASVKREGDLTRTRLCFDRFARGRDDADLVHYVGGTVRYIDQANLAAEVERPFVAQPDDHLQAIVIPLCRRGTCNGQLRLFAAGAPRITAPPGSWLGKIKYRSSVYAGRYTVAFVLEAEKKP